MMGHLLIPLLLSAALGGQAAHPCDDVNTWASSVVVTTENRLEWCARPRDTQGRSFTSWIVYVNDTPSTLLNVIGGSPENAQGLVLYSALGAFFDGTHVYAIAGKNASGEGLATEFLTITRAPPADSISPLVLLGPIRRSGNSPNYSITATASDNVGVTRVVFWLDQAQIGVDTTAPYSMSFRVTTLGVHRVEARAFDAAGNVSQESIAVFLK